MQKNRKENFKDKTFAKGSSGNYTIYNSQNISSFNTLIDNTGKKSELEAIDNYYSYLHSENNNDIPEAVINCFALKLSSVLLGMISSNSFKLSDDGYFDPEFYKLCIKEASAVELTKEVEDTDMLIIYMKQLIQMLKDSEIIYSDSGTIKVSNPDRSKSSLYSNLLLSFWNKSDWEHIFPSDPEAASSLHANRNFLKDIILNSYRKRKLETICNDFFEMTGFSNSNDLVMISFLDFYFFTWLKHFGLLSYNSNSLYSPVCIEVTNHGRKLLKSL